MYTYSICYVHTCVTFQRQARELPTDVLQQTPGLPRKSLRMPVNASRVAQDSLDRDLRRNMALESVPFYC